ncbi:thiolase family protein [Paraburkholderia elongata]|uniref:propanoyl-CoA C-acyltransferase n=1 Tax=Paraburkholderia elongata TaxID=2675747 RepID=A0A972NZV4_9BURK|nr:thiolase family protein [Paraburkholderia elongata]NPT61539.1 thiolase family protein [Paraburkholderia elongata]
MRPVYVAGVGSTTFGKHLDRNLRSLGGEAVAKALVDAGIDRREIEAGYCGNALGAMLQEETGVGQHVLWEVGMGGLPIVNVENACASGSTALHLGWQGVASGQYDAVVVFGVDKAVMPKGTPLKVGAAEMEVRLGDLFPGYFAMVAQKHMEAYGTTLEQQAKVSVKNHDNGCLNPYAEFKKPLTVEEVLASPMIADPITLFSCCPNSDGAAAAILCSEAVVRRLGKPRVRVAGSVLATGLYDNQRDFSHWEIEEKAVAKAYEQAGVGPGDLSLVEVHDAFSICEIVHYEGLGLCARGEGGRLIDEGATAIGGRIPVNASGGLLAKGHPIGASGLGQIAELTWQLRGEATGRQVEGARVALAQMMGGSKEADARACNIHILIAE